MKKSKLLITLEKGPNFDEAMANFEKVRQENLEKKKLITESQGLPDNGESKEKVEGEKLNLEEVEVSK